MTDHGRPIDITPGQPAPAVVSPARAVVVAGRRVRAGVLAFAALTVMAAGGAGYFVLARPGAAPSGSLPAGSLPAGSLPESPRLVPPVAVAPSPGVPAGVPVESFVPARPRPSTAGSRAPGSSAPPPVVVVPSGSTSGTPPTTGPPPGPRLTAAYSAAGRPRPDGGIAGFHATIRLRNTGHRPAPNWRVTLTVPGGNTVRTEGPATASQDGDHVVFTTGEGGAVPPGGTVTFHFTADGVVLEWPYACTLNGRTCR